MARPRGDASFTEARRQEILKAAFEVFSRNGYRGGSLSQVSEIVNITEAGILHHFKTKANLLIEVLHYHDERATESMGEERLNGLNFVKAWLDLVDYNISVPGMVELYCIVSAEATAHDHPAHDYFKLRYENVIDFTIEAMTHIERDGHMRPDLNPEDLGRALVALSDGLQVQWLLDRKWDMIEEHKSFFRRILTDKALLQISGLLVPKISRTTKG
jgi:AcrR family transcriptional regulator